MPNNKQTTIERLVLVVLFTTLILSLLVLLYLYTNSLNSKQGIFKKGAIAIGISNFGDHKENLTPLVTEALAEKLQNSKYDVKKIKRNFFEAISDSLINEELDSLHLNKGLLITGKQLSNEALFQCKISTRNLYTQINHDSKANQLVTLRTPNLQEFTVDTNAQMVVDYTMAILLFSQKDFQQSQQLFNSCISNNKNSENTQFLAACHTFLGDMYLLEGKDKKAINAYLKAYKLHPSDEVLKAIIHTFINHHSYRQAKKYYDKIQDKKSPSLKWLTKKLDSLKVTKIAPTIINIPHQGSFSVQDNKHANLTINYIALTPYNFKGKNFFIYKTDTHLLGVFDAHGNVIKLPEFKEISMAKQFIQKRVQQKE